MNSKHLLLSNRPSRRIYFRLVPQEEYVFESSLNKNMFLNRPSRRICFRIVPQEEYVLHIRIVPQEEYVLHIRIFPQEENVFESSLKKNMFYIT